ncbi:MAG TPA: exosortase/archaeosortase family protein [Planctomycetaceae bacterium]|jgi:exosortase|nr:exosortase/archaeosortase family protein [Planctomycetaceae bacterium]
MNTGFERLHREEASNGQTTGLPLRLSRASIVGLLTMGAVILVCHFAVLTHLAGRWKAEANYSHGFLVPFISGWLLWHRRDLIAVQPTIRGRWVGFALVILSVLVRLFAAYFGFLLAEPLAFILCIAGATALIGGFAALRWAWPAIAFLVFMIPLPGAVGSRLGGPLQHLATLGSTYVLQTLGIPAVASGNVICLTHGRIGVAEACNGLGMLTTFGAVTTAAVFLLKLSGWENVCVLASSVAIALLANICRIAATGVVQELIGVEFAERFFHDFAGLVMVPLALLMLGTEVLLLSKLFPRMVVGPLLVVRQTAGASPRPGLVTSTRS